MTTCWECGGTGVDPGSLLIEEPCPVCWGVGTLAPDLVEELKIVEHLRRIA